MMYNNPPQPLAIEPSKEAMVSRIIVVDDERVVTEVVEQYLRREGYEVSLTSDGVSALRLAQEWVPDLVILDLMLPGINGLEVCRQIRKESTVPIIMLTVKGEETDRRVGLELGANDYVAKQLTPESWWQDFSQSSDGRPQILSRQPVEQCALTNSPSALRRAW